MASRLRASRLPLALVAPLLLAAAPLQLTAEEEARFPAEEANQGVASGERVFWAIGNQEIGKYDARTGERLAHWQGDPERFPHLNSCELAGEKLVCASSNYPATPMASELVWFDAATLTLERIDPLGHGHGSLTWFARHDGASWACYANYDGKGGEKGRDHRATTLVRMDDHLRETGIWTFPDTVLARFAPRSSSGGSWGADGLLYVSGHDARELYAMRVPENGKVLEHVATIATPTGGQAIAIDQDEPDVLWSIERKTRDVVRSRLPEVAVASISQD
ncbi:hypothetical protein B2G71_03680 [Novosphingobium sp. PC22D]|uniref:hypothetical protein n=1 Tax=Novosphingobium sp. PC22D TaxID=1962403 RepID=UPI000BF0D674|nr:hypothetical protein [Novosphingobium sp. PC22D]PEQ14770.1 hypothetical protein B2G71_03680 [Novosphingobium sp. PC22D]